MKKNAKIQLEENGYAVIRGLLNPSTDLEPLKASYSRLVDELAGIYTERAGSCMPVHYSQHMLARKLCYLIGISHGKAFNHLIPSLRVMYRDYSWDGELPCAQLPEMFELIHHPTIIGMIREFIGPEIYSTPMFHMHIKPTHEQMNDMEEISTRLYGCTPAEPLFNSSFLEATAWHTDAHLSLANARESNIINAWIPLTKSTIDNGCLVVVPGSHRMELPKPPFPGAVTDMGVPIEAVPGDVVFTMHNTLHCSLENKSDNDYRWAFNTRYCATGEPSGRPYLPGFIAHSLENPSRVLKDAAVWQQMWKNSLENIKNIQPVPIPWETSMEDALAISRDWKGKAPDPEAWLNLGERS